MQAVRALFAAAPESVLRLYFDARTAPHAGDLSRAMAQTRRPYRLVEPEELAKLAGSVHHGGIVAVAKPRPIPDLDPVAALDWAADGAPLLVLDGIGNPHNLGAIARTAAFFGLPRIILSDHPAQAMPSDSAYRVSEGGLFVVGVWRARGLADTLRILRERYLVVGTALERGRPFERFPAGPKPIALVLGNEETGIPATTLDACNAVVRIPGAGAVQSLNVSASAAVLAWELARRRGGPSL
ncbi:MAG TPA: RNA methyltransferase [Azospirillaceae bacterium]|nr:RNA methyltransferase [Azospirillaceae bacterium]